LIGAAPGTPLYQDWIGRLFYIPAIAGGVFGLLGGYLTDRLGRRRVLTWSILIYAFAAFAAGYSTSIYMLLVCRCFVFVGVCVEFVAAVAWLAELFPNPAQREKVLGYTQAFSSVGGLLVALAYKLSVTHAASFPVIHLPEWLNFFGGEIKDAHAPWRYTLMSGIIPAIPLIVIRPFLPESPAWAEKKATGTLKRPSLAALFSPELRRTTIVTTAMFALAYGAAFGAIQHMPRIIPGLAEVKQVAAAAGKKAGEGKEGAEQAKASRQAAGRATQQIVANISLWQEIGGLVGRFALAVVAIYIVSRRTLVRSFQIPGLIVMPIVFAWCLQSDLNWARIGMFVAAFLTIAQFSFWGNYLPRAYPLHLRGTGESFAANIGGRLIGTSFAWITAQLATTTDPAMAASRLAYTAAAIGFAVFLGGFILSFWLPEPKDPE
jgi:MFS family permease